MDTTVSLIDLNFELPAFGRRAVRCQLLLVGLGSEGRDLKPLRETYHCHRGCRKCCAGRAHG